MENWKYIPGFHGIYRVSDRGHVMRVSGGGGAVIGRILKPRPHSSGYHYICLYHGRKKMSTGIHRLVAAAFIGRCPRDKQVNHKDGDKKNNHVANLEYMTRKENARHAVDVLGINPSPKLKGSAHGRAKLTESDVRNIRKCIAKGRKQASVAKEFSIGTTQVSRIARGEQWSHI